MAVPQFCIVTMTYILMIKEIQDVISTHKQGAGQIRPQQTCPKLNQTIICNAIRIIL